MTSNKNVEAFRRYRESVNAAFDLVEEGLDKGEYDTACQAMASATKSTAKVSVALRNALIKQGLIAEEL